MDQSLREENMKYITSGIRDMVKNTFQLYVGKQRTIIVSYNCF